jgi:hypothetical protein
MVVVATYLSGLAHSSRILAAQPKPGFLERLCATSAALDAPVAGRRIENERLTKDARPFGFSILHVLGICPRSERMI